MGINRVVSFISNFLTRVNTFSVRYVLAGVGLLDGELPKRKKII